MTRPVRAHRHLKERAAPPRDPYAAPAITARCQTCTAPMAPEHMSDPMFHRSDCTAYPRGPEMPGYQGAEQIAE